MFKGSFYEILYDIVSFRLFLFKFYGGSRRIVEDNAKTIFLKNKYTSFVFKTIPENIKLFKTIIDFLKNGLFKAERETF